MYSNFTAQSCTHNAVPEERDATFILLGLLKVWYMQDKNAMDTTIVTVKR